MQLSGTAHNKARSESVQVLYIIASDWKRQEAISKGLNTTQMGK
jgi:hypothetical protein